MLHFVFYIKSIHVIVSTFSALRSFFFCFIFPFFFLLIFVIFIVFLKMKKKREKKRVLSMFYDLNP